MTYPTTCVNKVNNQRCTNPIRFNPQRKGKGQIPFCDRCKALRYNKPNPNSKVTTRQMTDEERAKFTST